MDMCGKVRLTMTKITCPVCGKENDALSKYCSKCDSTLQVVKKRKPEIEAQIDVKEALPGIENADSVNIPDEKSSGNISKVLKHERHSNVRGKVDENVQTEVQTHPDHLEMQLNHSEPNVGEIDEGEGGSFIKLNYGKCPFCGYLNKQNVFFCQQCGCDLKYAKTVKVPAGDIEVYQKKHQYAVKNLLIQKSSEKNPDNDIKQFEKLSSNRNVKTKDWKLGREMSIEGSGVKADRFVAGSIGLAYIVLRSMFRNVGSGFFILLLFAIPVIRKMIRQKNDQDKSVIINDSGVEIWENEGKKNKKIRSISWEQIDHIKIVGKGNHKKLSLEANDPKDTCVLPSFDEKKRAMLLNTFGIIANNKGYRVINTSE